MNKDFKAFKSFTALFRFLFKVVMWVFVLLLLGVSSCVIIYLNKNDTPINSPLVGTEFEVPPNTGKAKMSDWGGWTDRYFHLQNECERRERDHKPFTRAFYPFDKFTKLKVIEVRAQNHGLGSTDKICVLQEVSNPNDLISTPCDKIEDIKIHTDLLKQALELIRTEGKVTITHELDERMPNPTFKVFDNEEKFWKELAADCRTIGFDGFRIIKN